MKREVFNYPPTVEVLKILTAGSLKQNLAKAVRIWVILRSIYGDESDEVKLDLKEEFSFLEWRDLFFIDAKKYHKRDCIPNLHNKNELITNAKFSFSQRFRQPPTDEINSLLSFGYTLLYNNVLSFIITEGLSPYIGHFHYGDKQKTYLAFDLMEEFRSPIVDSLILKVINKALFKPKDFDVVATTGGVYLSQTARRVFLRQFENRMNEEISHPDLISQVTYRHAIQLQVRRYKRCLLSDMTYESFLRAD